MRIKQHPVLNFEDGRQVTFVFEGKELTGTEGQPIICALTDNGITIVGHSHGRPRGLYCAIGNCGSCLATVNGRTNVRTCVTPLEEGMVITMQRGKGVIT